MNTIYPVYLLRCYKKAIIEKSPGGPVIDLLVKSLLGPQANDYSIIIYLVNKYFT
jgi:hypothetical protein